MGLIDFLMGWKVINDQGRNDLTDDEEVEDLIYIAEQMKKEQEQKENIFY